MTNVTNAITWFEIPTSDFERAVAFYTTIFGHEISTGDFMGVPHAFFPYQGEGVGGAIISRPDTQPGSDGPVIYLNAGNELSQAVARVETAGGQVLMPVTSIGEQGYIALILDTEGNRVGLHASA